MGILNSCLVWLSRLKAHEAIASASQMAVGSGAMESSSKQDLWNTWLRQTHAPQRSTKVNPTKLATMGIGVTLVPKKAAP